MKKRTGFSRRIGSRRFGRTGWLDGIEGVDFVRCRLCGDHRRVISGRHLVKHGTDREEYMEEYGLTPDKLIAADFRQIQSSRPGFRPLGRKQWIAAIKKIYQQKGNVFARRLQEKKSYLYDQGIWLFGSWDNALRAAGFTPEQMRLHKNWDGEKVIKAIRQLRIQKQQLNAHYVNKNNPALFQAALRYYGDWNKALRVAGVFTPSMLKNATARRNLARTLRGKPHGAVTGALKLQAELYFGSVRNALKQAKERNE